jgi:hypothetical protein
MYSRYKSVISDETDIRSLDEAEISSVRPDHP